MHESYKKWLDEGSPKVYCSCGCDKEIIIKPRTHKYDGIPKYINGHHTPWNKDKTKVYSEETLQKMRNARLGKHLSEETKQKIRESTLDENNHFYGKKHTEESKQKIKNNKPDQSGKNHPMYGKHHSKESKQKNRENQPNQSGEKNPAWKGGITPLTKSIRGSNEYSEWRLQIFGRDNFTCQCCGIRGTYLEVHHIKSFNDIIKEYNITNIEKSLNCEILWKLDNGITYCKECHDKLKKKGGII